MTKVKNEEHQKYPPTPPGSTGCESPAGRLPLVPLTSGNQWCRGPPPPPRPQIQAGSLWPHWRNSVHVSNLFTASNCSINFAMPFFRFLNQLCIVSGSKYNFVCPKGPCGTTFSYSQSEIYDIRTKIIFASVKWP